MATGEPRRHRATATGNPRSPAWEPHPLPPPAEGQSSPLEADPLQTAIYDRFAIEVPIGPFPVPAAESPDPPRRLIRVSAALHNDHDDIDRLVDALRTIGSGS